MPTITLSVPEDLKREMDDVKVINWSAVAREAIREKLAQLHILKAITAKSKLTPQQAEALSIEIGRKVNKSMHERFKKEHPGAY